jgi:hypothetical protein
VNSKDKPNKSKTYVTEIEWLKSVRKTVQENMTDITPKASQNKHYGEWSTQEHGDKQINKMLVKIDIHW